MKAETDITRRGSSSQHMLSGQAVSIIVYRFKMMKYVVDCWWFWNKVKCEKDLMHYYCGTITRVRWWTFMGPWNLEVRPGAKQDSANPIYLAAPAMNAHDTQNIHAFR